MFRRFAVWAFVLTVGTSLLTPALRAQGPDTKANKDDWEEINFEFNSSVLVDGFPSLLRVADLLKSNNGFRVQVEGNTDEIGGKAYNQRLGLARANAVRDFLIKYGASTNQITVNSAADSKPRTKASKRGYSPTDEGRYMNRRVTLTVLDAQGKPVGDGSAADVIRNLANGQNGAGGRGIGDCCNDVQRKLDALNDKLDKLSKLDNIEKLLAGVADENKRLKDELDALKKSQDQLQAKVDSTSGKVDQTATAVAALPKPPSADAVAKATVDEHERRNPKFEMLGVNVGPTSSGDATFTGKGRFFSPIGKNFAFQSEGEYFYSKGQREGQFDFGGVERIRRFEAGLFASFKHVNMTGNQTGGTLGQAAFTADYLFKWGKIGAYGTKAFMDDALVNSVAAIGPNGAILNQIYTQTYLRVVDQAGISGTGPLYKNSYFEGNMGYLKSTTAGDRFGGTLRLIFPLEKYPLAFTVEGGVNETLLGRGNTGRAVVGLQFGKFIHPKDLLAADHATPMQIPRLRYEVLTRTVRIGNDPPVADAGPNQALTGAATVTLDGSRSYDPNGDQLTFLWQQDSGPAVTLSNPNAAITSFAAAGGQDYTFRLKVSDPSGAFSIARVAVSTGGPIILSFTATQATGSQPATLNWNVANADTITITGLGNVTAQGSAPVTPLSTTTYQITATRGSKTVTATVTVVPVTPTVVSFTANPASITSGGSTTLGWQTTGADAVTISGLGSVTQNGTISVSPTTTTTYLLTATKGGLVSTSSVTVQVSPRAGGQPAITAFTVSQQGALAGTPLTLSCSATNAASISLSGAGISGATVTINGPSASITVTPFVNTNYICVATGSSGLTDQKQLTVTVVPQGLGGGQ